jgi:hypothetical protein
MACRRARPRWVLVWGSVLALTLLQASRLAAQTSAFTVRSGSPEQNWAAQVEIGPILADPALRDALDSALPLRFHLRVELWRNGFLDRLVGSDEVSVAILQDPLSREYAVETATEARSGATIAEAQAALRDLLTSSLRPERAGRHYYLAVLEVETLSLSDLEELRRWLRGDVGAALEGRAPPTRAVERGLRRILVRVIGLPTRRFEASSGTFTAG